MREGLKLELLRLSRWTLERWSRGEDWSEGGPTVADDEAVGGLFVTLTRGGSLRGCIGTMHEQGSVVEALREMTVQAAGGDPRFMPVRESEVADLDISVSLLGTPQPVTDLSTIEIGRHGLILELDGQRGLFLPEVPVEEGWDLERYLQELCAKAGLPPGSWRQPKARLSSFESLRLSESAG